MSRKEGTASDPSTIQVSGIMQRVTEPRSTSFMAVGNTLDKRVETRRDDRGQEGTGIQEKRGAGEPDFRIGAREAWNRRTEEPVSYLDRQCIDLVVYATTIRYTSDGHFFLQLQHKAQALIQAMKIPHDQILPTAWEFLEDTLALFYVIEEGGRIRPKQGYGLDEVQHCKQLLGDMRDNRTHEMQENLKRFPPIDMQQHHLLVGGTNQRPESTRTLWVPEPRKEVMVGHNLRQDREVHEELRGGASLPMGSSRDVYHFLGTTAGRDKDLTTTVNRDVTEDYDHVSKVTPASLKRTVYFQSHARDLYMPTLAVSAEKLNESMASAVQYGMLYISTKAGDSPNLNQTDLAKVRYPEKALAHLRAATEAARLRPSAESQVALFESIIVMFKALAMALTLRVSRTLTPQVGAGLLNIWSRLVQGEFPNTVFGALMSDVMDQEMLHIDHQWNAMMAYFAFRILPAEIAHIHRNRFEMTQQGTLGIQEFARMLNDRSKNIEYKDEMERQKDMVRVYQKGLSEENKMRVYRYRQTLPQNTFLSMETLVRLVDTSQGPQSKPVFNSGTKGLGGLRPNAFGTTVTQVEADDEEEVQIHDDDDEDDEDSIMMRACVLAVRMGVSDGKLKFKKKFFTPRCPRCGDHTHVEEKCVHAGRVCFRCRSSEHEIRDCPEPKPEKS